MKEKLEHLPAVTANPRWLGYRCVVCDLEFPCDHEGFVCPDCGIDGILDVVYDLAAIARDPGARQPAGPGIWKYAPLLPISPATEHRGFALQDQPWQSAPRLATHLGLAGIILKDDTLLPSGSFKDRAAVVAVARARQLGIDHIACASTGNAAASLAVFAARAGLTSTIFVPAAAPRAKLAQLLVHGARVIRVDGTYDQAFELSLREIAANSWYSRNCAHNPLLVEGKKTAILSLGYQAAQNPDLDWPDAVFVPVGDGCIVSSVAKGLTELQQIGVIDKVPRVIGVQAEGAAPLAEAWATTSGDHRGMSGRQILAAIQPVVPDTMADSISVGIPRNRLKAWQYVAATEGAFITVSDQAISETIGLLARTEGVFAEPSGAAGLAGVSAALETGLIKMQDRVAVLITGNGLKDPQGWLAGINLQKLVPPEGPA